MLQVSQFAPVAEQELAAGEGGGISRSNCANDSNTCSVSRPIGVLLLSCWVTGPHAASPPGSSRRAGGYSPVLRLTADEMSLPLFPCPKKFTFWDTTLLPRGTFWVRVRAGPLADAPRPFSSCSPAAPRRKMRDRRGGFPDASAFRSSRSYGSASVPVVPVAVERGAVWG